MNWTGNSTNVSTDCIEFNTRIFHAVAIVRAVSGFLSVLASLLVILLIVVFKKYLFFTQRLILYLSIASMLNGLTIATQGANYFPDNEYSETYCSISAFLEQTTHWSLLLAFASITIDIYLREVHQVKKKPDIAYIVVIFISPVFFNWIPFIDNTYGQAGAWCWIVLTRRDCTTTHFGLILRYLLWYGPLYVVVLGIIVIYIVVYVAMKRNRRQYHSDSDPNRKAKMKQRRADILSLIFYPIIFLLLQIPPTMNRIAELFTDEELLPLWFLHSFFSPLQGGFIVIVYALDPDTRRRLLQTLKSCGTLCRKKPTFTEYPIPPEAKSDSISNKQRMNYLQA